VGRGGWVPPCAGIVYCGYCEFNCRSERDRGRPLGFCSYHLPPPPLSVAVKSRLSSRDGRGTPRGETRASRRRQSNRIAIGIKRCRRGIRLAGWYCFNEEAYSQIARHRRPVRPLLPLISRHARATVVGAFQFRYESSINDRPHLRSSAIVTRRRSQILAIATLRIKQGNVPPSPPEANRLIGPKDRRKLQSKVESRSARSSARQRCR